MQPTPSHTPCVADSRARNLSRPSRAFCLAVAVLLAGNLAAVAIGSATAGAGAGKITAAARGLNLINPQPLPPSLLHLLINPQPLPPGD
jgi:hypothetical protein